MIEKETIEEYLKRKGKLKLLQKKKH